MSQMLFSIFYIIHKRDGEIEIEIETTQYDECK